MALPSFGQVFSRPDANGTTIQDGNGRRREEEAYIAASQKMKKVDEGGRVGVSDLETRTGQARSL